MKRTLKIIGITLVSLVAAVIIAAAVIVWVVVTPEKLSPIVRDVAKEYVTVPHELGDIDLTFFSSFPAFGVRIEGLEIVNPVEGAQNDTLLSAKEVVATIDIMAFLNDKKLDVHALTLRDVRANIYIDSVGHGNWEVFALPPDTTNDTTAFELPFDEIHVNNATMASNRLSLVDRKDSIEASIEGFGFDATVENWDDIRLQLKTLAVNARLKNTDYVKNAQIELDVPCGIHLDSMHFELRDAALSIDSLKIGLDGWAQIADTIRLDARVKAEKWEIRRLLALVPEPYRPLLKDIQVDGWLSLNAHAYGAYGDSVMPIIDASVALDDASGKYRKLPYKAEKVSASVEAHLDLNDSLATKATAKLRANTRQSHIEAEADVREVLGNPLIDAQVRAKAHIPDFEYFLPKTLKIKGSTTGEVNVLARLSELKALNPQRGHYIDGRFDISRLVVDKDDIHADLPKTELKFRIPNQKPSDGLYRWLGAQLTMRSINAKLSDLKAETGRTQLDIETGNLMSKDPVLRANMRLNCEKDLKTANDSMSVSLSQPQLAAGGSYNTQSSQVNLNAKLNSPCIKGAMGDSAAATINAAKLTATMKHLLNDTTTLPTIDATLLFGNMVGQYTDIAAELQQSHMTMGISSEKKQKKRPKFRASLNTSALQVQKGNTVKAKTGTFAMDAQAQYNDQAKKFLLQWNPKMNVNLQHGEAELAMFQYPIIIPTIDFSYSNQLFTINRSQVHLGNSDFSLSGKVSDIGQWIDGKGVLRGDLNFVSDYTDINQLMTMFSADQGSEEEPQPKEEKKDKEASDGPFLVPTDVDLTLNTHIANADVFEQRLHNLKGKAYVQNGVLALEEMGFVCNAARLQLTAMYKTPRRNHLYLGLDYHMLDVDLDSLISMIPKVEEMLPMLSSFKGNAEFHLAAETFLNQNYEPKLSTLRGAASLSGKDLVVMDGETFGKIAKLLMFNKKTENKVDSLSVEMTVYKNEIDIYPFCVQMDNYMVALGGRHNTNMSFDYDINVLKPIYLGVNVSGRSDNLSIKLAPCKFAKDFRPIFHRKVDTESAELRKRIRQSMQKNVKL